MGLIRRRGIRRARRRGLIVGAAIGASLAGKSSGAQQVTEKDVEFYCQKCGKPHSGEAKFCPHCGALLE